MMTTAPDTVVFDLGNVLIDWDPRYLYRQIFDDEERVEQFLRDICSPDWIRQSDAGKPLAQCIAELTNQHPHEAEFIELFESRWPEMMRQSIGGSLQILHRLKAQGTLLFVLSNWSADTWPRAVAQFDFLDLFDGLVVSGLEGVAKPEPEIYRRLERFGVNLDRAAFIDDRAENIETANSLGMTGILFTGADALATTLSELGLLTT
jgi:2-haloacid dehalogenase